MKARSEYAEDNGMERGSCRRAMLIQPQPIQPTKKSPGKQNHSSGCVVSGGGTKYLPF